MLIILNKKFIMLMIFNGNTYEKKMSFIEMQFFFFGGGEGRSIRHTNICGKPRVSQKQWIFSIIVPCFYLVNCPRCKNWALLLPKFMLLYVYCTLIFSTLLSHFWSFRSKIWIHIRWRVKESCFLWWSERCSCS